VNLKVKRRDFFRFAGGGALGLATSGVTLHGLSTLNAALAAETVEVPGGPEGWSLGVCTLCPGGCGLRLRTIGKRAVKLSGNPLHPVNHGGLCPKGLAGLQRLYHPDRLRAPQKNVGTREQPKWKEVSWDEAIQNVVIHLRQLQDQKQAHAAVFVAGASGHLRNRLFRKFLQAYGSPNFMEAPSGMEANQIAAYLQQGMSEGLAYDLEDTRYLLSFGVNLLEGWGAPVRTMRAFGKWRDSTGGRRTKLVQIEPRFSVTAARADEWVSLRPGAEAALALGIAYVLISEGLYDTRFVSERTFGFEDWSDNLGRRHMGFRSLVLGEYRLNEVAALTDVPAETILRLGREFGRNRPALALGGYQTSTLPCDPWTALAVHSLNALVGSVEGPGGMLSRPPLPGTEAPSLETRGHTLPAAVTNGSSLRPWPDLTRLPEAILSGKPYPVKAVLVHGVDPVFSLPNGQDFAQALSRVPFVVSFSSFLDETTALADLILPDSTDLEKWQEAPAPPGFPSPLLSVSPPAVKPVHDTRDTADVVLQIARALGGPVAAALPSSRFEHVLRVHVEQLFAARVGYTFTSGVEETWNRLLERSGWWAPAYSTTDELWEQMKGRGGWWEPTYFYGEWNRVLQTPSGRFEFYSQRLADWAAQHRKEVESAGFKPGDDHLGLPRQPRLGSSPPEFPLLLVPIEVLPLAGGTGGELPFLQQIAGVNTFEKWESWLEMNPATAQELGLEDRDFVWVESPRGRARVKLRLFAGARPGVVHLPIGYGQTQGPEWSRRGVNPFQLIVTDRDPLTGLLQATRTPVRVYRA